MTMNEKNMKKLVEEARIFGDCFLGDTCFNGLKDFKKWKNFLRKNKLDREFGIIHRENGDHNDGWFLICYPN